MEIPKDTVIESLLSDAQHIAERSNHSLAHHAVQCLQQLRKPLHTQAERNAAFAAVSSLYCQPGFSYGTPVYEGVIDDLDDLESKLAVYLDADTIAAEAAAFGRGAVGSAIDQQREHDSLDEALCSYWENAADTLAEVFHSLRDDGRFVVAYRAMERAFRDELAKQSLTCSLFI